MKNTCATATKTSSRLDFVFKKWLCQFQFFEVQSESFRFLFRSALLQL